MDSQNEEASSSGSSSTISGSVKRHFRRLKKVLLKKPRQEKNIIIGDAGMDTQSNVALENTIIVVLDLFNENKRMSKELNSMKEGQSVYEHKMQAILDSYTKLITDKDDRLTQLQERNRIVEKHVTQVNDLLLKTMKNRSDDYTKQEEKLRACVEMGLKNSTDNLNSNIDLNNKIENLQEKMELLLTENKSLIKANQNLTSIKNQENHCTRYYEEKLRICMELGLKNSSDNVNANDEFKSKIEYLQKTVDTILTEKNSLIESNQKLSLMAAAEINSLKSRLAKVESSGKNIAKEKQYKTDIKNIKSNIEKNYSDIKMTLQDIENRRVLHNDTTEHKRKYDKLKMRLCMIENQMKHVSEQSMQNMVMMSTACARGGYINQSIPNVVYETKVQPASNSPRPQPNSPPASRPTQSQSACPPPPPPPPQSKPPQGEQYPRYTINNELLKDMHKQLRKSGESIRKIPKRSDMKISCSVAKTSGPLPPLAPLLPPPPSPFPEAPIVDGTSDEGVSERQKAPKVASPSDGGVPGQSEAPKVDGISNQVVSGQLEAPGTPLDPPLSQAPEVAFPSNLGVPEHPEAPQVDGTSNQVVSGQLEAPGTPLDPPLSQASEVAFPSNVGVPEQTETPKVDGTSEQEVSRLLEAPGTPLDPPLSQASEEPVPEATPAQISLPDVPQS